MTYADELDSIQDWPKITRPVKEIQDEHMAKFVDFKAILQYAKEIKDKS